MMSSEIHWKLEEPEWFRFVGVVFDVRKAKRIIHDRPREIDTFNPADLASWIGKPGVLMFGVIGIDWSRALSDEIDLAIPVILAQVKDTLLPIDGWHRIAKANHKKIEELSCVVLSAEESYDVGAPRPDKTTKPRDKKKGSATRAKRRTT